ncbi:AzlC family ABC transporter permease [Clostridium sp. HBUAS56017]|uniref:AzlC family ABC transporter permease n=1 Tax=Clostridium sp. HBUAS56017 TaxID=2571128 RepID=UPI0011787F30|nr:AzlC family ABC transporter permease [Clostridium sp. HBUAS56017]
MDEKLKALTAAFKETIPVLTGFTFLGMAYGILMSTKGYAFYWSTLMSAIVFAGSMQYIAITTLLTAAFNPLYALFLTLMINARHLFYGISMLKRFKGIGKVKPFLIFYMCDETFSIIFNKKAPKGVKENYFFFFIAFLDYLYWVIASTIGGLLGKIVNFNTEGIDFVLTALFIVMFLEQWKNSESHKAAIIGLVCSIISLVIFGENNFIIPAMICILIILTLFKTKLERSNLINDINTNSDSYNY